MPAHQKYILSGNIKKIAQDWQKWQGTTIRPLAEHIAIYEKHFRKLAQGKKPRLLILGATPELRTLGHKYKFEITCADRNLNIYLAMNLLTRGQVEKEIFVKNDWRDLSLENGYYDLVAGDDVLNMLSWPEWDSLFAKVSSLLKSKGYFSTHLIVKHCDEWNREKLENVFKKYERGEIKNPQDFLVQAAATMWNPRTYEFSWQKFLKKVKYLKDRKKIKSDFGIYARYKNFAGVSVLPPQKKFEKLARKYFKIISCDYAKQFEYCKSEPVYLLQKV
ncbi:MAG: class I SAM-dependent methyltransferase [Patescibacteria group bacterium]|nr:class I SAM-dependent methyltransferase [Patescibacteria group bacterium]